MAERKELKRSLSGIKAKMAELDDAILKAEEAGEDTTAFETEFAASKKQAEAVRRSIARKESLEDDVEDETKKEADDDGDDNDEDDEKKSKKSKKNAKSENMFGGLQSPAVHRNMFAKNLSPAQKAGAYFWGRAAAKMEGQHHAYTKIMEVWKDESIAKAAVGAMDTTIPTIVQDASQVVIDILSAKSIVRASGCRIEDMARGNKTLFRQNVGAQAFYFGEGQTSTVSKVGFDHIDLSWHKMGALVYLTKEEMLFPSINTGEYVVNEITRRIALSQDKTVLLSPTASGSPPWFEPQGIPAYVASGSIISSTEISSAVTWQSIANDLASLESLMSGNLQDPPYVLYMHPNVGTFLKAVTNGFTFPFREELSKAEPTLNGHRVYYSTQLPSLNNTGTYLAPVYGETLTTPIYMVKPSQLIIADAYQYDVQMSGEGSFNDGGTQVNLWGEQKVAFLATAAWDFAMEHDVSVALLNATGWTTAAGGMAAKDRYTQASSQTTSSASSVLQPSPKTINQ